MPFIKLLHRILPKFDFSLLPLSPDTLPDLMWRQKVERETNQTLRIASIIGLIVTIIWLFTLERPLQFTDMLPFLIVGTSLIFSFVQISYFIQSSLMYVVLYFTGIVLLGSQNTIIQSQLFFYACVLGVCGLIGIRWGVIVLAVSTVLVASFSCGMLVAPFSANCMVELTPETLIGNLAVFVLMASVALFSFHGITSKVKEGLIHERELSAALTQKSEDLTHALAKEQEINQIRSNLINVVSHEFRTPLTVISLSSKMLKRKYSKDKLTHADLEKYHGQIDENLGRLANLIDIVVANKPETDNELNQLVEQVKGDSWEI